jgi:bacterioferritin-associated ferredoxin
VTDNWFAGAGRAPGRDSPKGEKGVIRCACTGVGERRLRRLVRRGATTTAAIGEACGAGTDCGACLEDLAALIADETRTSRTRRPFRWHGRPPSPD